MRANRAPQDSLRVSIAVVCVAAWTTGCGEPARRGAPGPAGAPAPVPTTAITGPAADVDAAPPAGAYGECTPSADGIGRTYFGREIAHYMTHLAIPWLERVERYVRPRWLRVSLTPMPNVVGVILIALALVVIRAIRGPTVFDRVLARNSVGTLAILLLAAFGFLTGRPEWLDIGLTYGLLNLISTFAVLKFFRHGDLAYDVEEED